jgi:hypothetical protein
VTASDDNAFGGCGHQRHGNAAVFLIAQEVFRIADAEGESHHRGDRRERDVALFPTHAQTEHLVAFVNAMADDAHIGHAGSIGPCIRPRKREAGNVVAACKARQIVGLLRVGAVVQQQLRRPQRIGHHHRHGGGDAAGGDFTDDRRVRLSGEAETAEFLRDDHTEEAVGFDEVPGCLRQVVVLLNPPVVQHGAEIFHGPGEERFFFDGERCFRRLQQHAPVRFAGEEFRVPPHGAGFDSLALGVRHGRQAVAVPSQQRTRQRIAPPGGPFVLTSCGCIARHTDSTVEPRN